MTSTPLIELSDLKVERGSFALDIRNWKVTPGQVVGLVGPNGAGKTTLLETLAGLRPRNAGALNVLGADPWADPVTVRSSLGFMTDDMPVFHMRIGPLMRMLSGYYNTWDADLVDELLERFKLDPKQKTSDLSRGQGTRLRLVTAMAFRPRLLLLDEPAAGLDLAGRHTLLKSVLEVVRNPERSVIVSTHLLQDVERITDRLLVIDGGKVVQDGATDVLVGHERTLEEALMAWGAAG
jgi:ABC-2 type transport system ATP-binding protein